MALSSSVKCKVGGQVASMDMPGIMYDHRTSTLTAKYGRWLGQLRTMAQCVPECRYLPNSQVLLGTSANCSQLGKPDMPAELAPGYAMLRYCDVIPICKYQRIPLDVASEFRPHATRQNTSATRGCTWLRNRCAIGSCCSEAARLRDLRSRRGVHHGRKPY